jgi:hypothetical protein
MLNLITLGQKASNNINRMTTINDVLLIQSTELLVILDKFKIEMKMITSDFIDIWDLFNRARVSTVTK